MIIPNLKKLRLENDLTQKDVAKVLDISYKTYGINEIGSNTITLENLVALCDYYNRSVDYVLGLSSIEKYKNSKKGIDKPILAARLKETRLKKKKSQQAIADLLNTNHSVWSRYESGETTISTSFLYAYCKEYHISADYLLGKID